MTDTPPMLIKLTKLSAPGWQAVYTCWEDVHAALIDGLCHRCLLTKHQCYHLTLSECIQEGMSRNDAVEAARLEADLCIPDDYLTLSKEDKVGHLLNTPCGAEYLLELRQNHDT